jgi:hypothetical protein
MLLKIYFVLRKLSDLAIVVSEASPSNDPDNYRN